MSKTIEEEKLDYLNVVMPVCKLGCDDLFEKGYIIVKDGIVVRMDGVYTTPYLENYILSLQGRKCEYWHENSKRYFQWHSEFHSKN